MDCLSTYNIDLNNVIDYNYHNYLIYCVLLMFSFYMIYFGNKIIKPTLFITGLSSSLFIQNAATNLLIHNNIVRDDDLNCKVYMTINLFFGLFLGSLLCYFYKLSIFALGSISFGSITYMGLNIIENYNEINANTGFIVVGTSSLLGGALSLRFIEKLSIIITVLFGSFLGTFAFKQLISEPMHKYIYLYIPVYSIVSVHGIYIQNRRKKKQKDEPLLTDDNISSYQ